MNLLKNNRIIIPLFIIFFIILAVIYYRLIIIKTDTDEVSSTKVHTTKLKTNYLNNRYFSARDAGRLKFNIGSYASFQDFQKMLEKELEKEELSEEIDQIKQNISKQITDDSDLVLGFNSLNSYKKEVISIIGYEPWSTLLSLKPPMKPVLTNTVGSIQEKVGLSFWLKTRSDQYVIVKIDKVKKSTGLLKKDGTVTFSWIWALR